MLASTWEEVDWLPRSSTPFEALSAPLHDVVSCEFESVVASGSTRNDANLTEEGCGAVSASGSKDPASTDSQKRKAPDEAIARQRELNRLAQVRYRARQRERRAATELQRLELRAYIDAARAEARALEAEHLLLSRMLEQRDRGLGILQAAGRCPIHQSGWPRMKACCYREEEGFTIAQTALLHANCMYGDKMVDLDASLSPHDIKAFQGLSFEILFEFWVRLRQEMKGLVESMEEAPHQEKDAHLLRIMRHGRAFKWRVLHYRPGMLVRLRTGGDTSIKWGDIVGQLGMSDKQWGRMRLIGEAMRMKLEKVMTERQLLTASLTRALAEEQGASLHTRNRQALQVRSLIEDLDANSFKERDVYCRAAWGIFWTLLKPIQKARLILFAEGATPLDLVRVMEDLEAEFGPVSRMEDPEGFRVKAMDEWDRIDLKMCDPAFKDIFTVNHGSS